MRIKRIFNNNAVLAYKDTTEVVIFGKGVGFQKKHGDRLDNTKIEKMFTLTEKQTSHFETLFKDIPAEYSDLTYKIVKQAEADLHIKFDGSIYIAILDHINYALIRAEKGIFLKNELLWQIKRTYKKEYEAASKTLDIIREELGVVLPDDEAGVIAIHYYNAQDPRIHMQTTYQAADIIQNIVKIIQFQFRIEFEEDDMNYNRLMTHLRFFITGLLNNERKVNEMEDDFLFTSLIRQYPQIYDCTLKIRRFILKKVNKEVTDEEAMYLMIHIQRIVEKEKNKKKQGE